MNNEAFTKLSYGLYIITAWNDGKATGCTANAAMQVTASPASVAISINNDNFTNECIKKSGQFAISILGENSDAKIIGNFGFKSGRDSDKFADYEPIIKSHLPIVSDSVAYICCEVINTMETETHTVFLGKVLDADILKDDTPMTYAYYHNVIKGKTQKNAPTYIEE